ncbi:MAG: sensor histidine kinase [Phycisphaerae bacterium]
MRVALKVVLAMVLVLVLIRLVDGMLTVRRETARLNAAIERDAELLGRVLRHSLQNAWLADGRERAIELLEGMNVRRHPLQFSWASFDHSEILNERLDDDSRERLRQGEIVSLRTHRSDKGDVQYFFFPLDVPDADGAIQMAETLEDRSRHIRHALVREILGGGVMVLASGTAVILLGIVVIGKPLSRLRERVRQIGEGDLSRRIRLRGGDELSALAEGLNEMCSSLSASRERERAETEKRIAAMEQVRHMDRLTTIGRLASGIAHELGTPLNVISGRAEMISDGTLSASPEHLRRNAETIKTQTDRMTKIIRHLLDFARQRPPQRVRTNAVDVVGQAVELVNCLGYEAEVRLVTDEEPSATTAEMDPVQVQQVMTNLIENALQAMPGGGNVVVSLDSVQTEPPEGLDTPSGRFIRIAVTDEGPGIAKDDLHNVFDPFFTTKDIGEGTGLGLSITYGIVREHGGWIDVQSKVNEGSTFTVYIPQQERR